MTIAAVHARRVAYASGPGRWVVAATALGSGMAFLDGSVVNVALPAIRRDLGGGLAVQQWVLDGYLLTLSALLLLGGALGDRYGRRRVFLLGLAAFALASLGCGLAPTGALLVGARALQGVAGALLVPGSLALIDASIEADDRGRAVGAWAGWSGVSSAVGPFLGGWLVDAASWRWVFLINLPIAALTVWMTRRHVPESSAGTEGRMDYAAAVLVTVGLAGAVVALIEVPARGWQPATVAAAVIGGAGLLAVPWVERRAADPMLPGDVFRSRQFVGANVTTLATYAALGGSLFLVAIQLQQSLHYSALEAGAALLPVTVVMLLLSARMGALAQRTGPRVSMSVGPVVAGGGLALLSMAHSGAHYATSVLPGVLVLGLGLAVTVAPLTGAVLAAVPVSRVGVASGINNAVARVAGLFAIALLPVAAGISSRPGSLDDGFGTAMLIAALACACGGVVAAVTIRAGLPVQQQAQPAVDHGCAHPCTCLDEPAVSPPRSAGRRRPVRPARQQ